MKKILFTGGGSAGHVVPNIALIEELLSSGKADICYIGTGGIEKGIVAEWKIPYYEIECPKLVRGGGFTGFKRNLKIPSAFFKAVKQAKKGLQTFRPDVVFSKGGFVSLPVVIAARKLKIPCYAHESDFSMGLANKLSSRFCKRVFTSFPETAKRVKRGKYSGAPIKRSVLSATRADARRSLGIDFSEKVVLIFGGGSGSQAINQAVRSHVKSLTNQYTLLHVCGKNNVVECSVKNYRQFEFVADMGRFYAAADLVVSRAGAGTVFEILALKKPSILIPLEGQTRGDQLENARYFSNKKLCTLLRQNQLHELPQAIEKTLSDGELAKRLLECSFESGNATILRELYSELSQ